MNYKKKVQTMYKKIAQQMGIQAPPLKIGGSNKKLRAESQALKTTMSKGVAKQVDEEPKLVEYLIAHELTHYMNRDHKTKFFNCLRFPRKHNAYSLMLELRASIGGYTQIGMKNEMEISETEKKLKKEEFPKLHDNNRYAYSVGYPTSKQIAYYASRTDKLTVEIARELLEDYCNVINVKDRENFIVDVLKTTKVY